MLFVIPCLSALLCWLASVTLASGAEPELRAVQACRYSGQIALFWFLACVCYGVWLWLVPTQNGNGFGGLQQILTGAFLVLVTSGSVFVAFMLPCLSAPHAEPGQGLNVHARTEES